MPDVKAIYGAGARGYQSAMVEAEARFRQAQLDDDLAGATEAAMQINNLRVAMQSWDNMAAEVQRTRQPAPMAGADDLSRRDQELCRKYGIPPGDLSIAKNWTATPGLSDEKKIETWLGNRQRLANDRASGAYRDDQGRVTR
jgi:hypothetical protein